MPTLNIDETIEELKLKVASLEKREATLEALVSKINELMETLGTYHLDNTRNSSSSAVPKGDSMEESLNELTIACHSNPSTHKQLLSMYCLDIYFQNAPVLHQLAYSYSKCSFYEQPGGFASFLRILALIRELDLNDRLPFLTHKNGYGNRLSYYLLAANENNPDILRAYVDCFSGLIHHVFTEDYLPLLDSDDSNVYVILNSLPQETRQGLFAGIQMSPKIQQNLGLIRVSALQSPESALVNGKPFGHDLNSSPAETSRMNSGRQSPGFFEAVVDSTSHISVANKVTQTNMTA